MLEKITEDTMDRGNAERRSSDKNRKTEDAAENNCEKAA